MPEEHSVAGGPADHGQHGEPHVRETLGREAAVADAQHVGHGLEQRPRILFQPVGLLQKGDINRGESRVAHLLFLSDRSE